MDDKITKFLEYSFRKKYYAQSQQASLANCTEMRTILKNDITTVNETDNL